MAIDDDVPDFQNPEDEARYWRSLARDLDSELESTREALEEYQVSSKELEQELERDISAREKRETDLTVSLEVSQQESQDWKAKFQSALKEHSKTLNHVTSELDSVRKAEQHFRLRVRDMELDNDDLEKSERALGSTLADMEARYGKAIERTALLEQELVDKARLEEQLQRLKDEVRDLNEEIAVLQETVATRPQSRASDFSRPQTPLQDPQPVSARHSLPLPSTSHGPANDEQQQQHLLTDGPISAEKTPKKASPTPDLAKTLRRQSAIPRSTSAQSVHSSSSPPTSKSPIPTSRIPTSSTTSDLSSLASGTTDTSSATPKYKASISPGVPTRIRTASRASPATQATSSPNVTQRSTPRSIREARANGMMHDLQSMTARVKAMTARVDSRRGSTVGKPAWGSAIPKPSATPQRQTLTPSQINAAQARIAARRAAAGGHNPNTTPRASVSRRSTTSSIASPGSLEDEMSRAAVSPTIRSRRPPSRLSSSQARRPSSRASISSRPTTPSLYERPTTPSSRPARAYKSSMTSRDSTGSNASMASLSHRRQSSLKFRRREQSAVSHQEPEVDEEDERW